MGGICGVITKEDCVQDLFYGTDYHSHLGTRRGGLAVWDKIGFTRYIHNIENAQFRSKFGEDIVHIRSDRLVRHPIGTAVHFDLDPEMVRFFNPKTEMAIRR